METVAWEKILAFEIGSKNLDYSFGIRLGIENKWSLQFTQNAITEYKKFMFLASVSDEMVSPSPVVDEVWHLHLLDSKSYSDFCKLLGKKISA